MDRMVLLLNRHPKFHASLTNRLWPISSMQLKCLTHCCISFLANPAKGQQTKQGATENKYWASSSGFVRHLFGYSER